MSPLQFSLSRRLGAVACILLALACWSATLAMNPPEPYAICAGLVVGGSLVLLGGGMGLLVQRGLAGAIIGGLLGLPTGLLVFVAYVSAGC